jgi:hypothetical protein
MNGLNLGRNPSLLLFPERDDRELELIPVVNVSNVTYPGTFEQTSVSS